MSDEAVKEAIKKTAMQGMEAYSIIGTVDSVDETARTCKVKPLNGDADLMGVRLQSVIGSTDGFVMIPETGSEVVVTFLNNKTGYVALMTEVDKVYLHGDQFGGLVKIEDLVNKINTIEDDINSLKQAFSSWAPVSQDGGAALKTAAGSWFGQTITKTQVADLENDTVVHG